jgi:hypothetical protein
MFFKRKKEGRFILETLHPRDASSQKSIIPEKHHPREASSQGRIILSRIIQGRIVPGRDVLGSRKFVFVYFTGVNRHMLSPRVACVVPRYAA